MHESSMQALIHVARVSGHRLRELSDDLETCELRRTEGILRQLIKECDALSACLARLAKHADSLPGAASDGANEAPTDDPSVLELVRRLRIGAWPAP